MKQKMRFLRCGIYGFPTDEDKNNYVNDEINCSLIFIDGKYLAKIHMEGDCTISRLYKNNTALVEIPDGVTFIMIDLKKYAVMDADSKRFSNSYNLTVDFNTEIRHINEKLDRVIKSQK